MVVIVDANILISALIKADGKVGKMIFSDEYRLELICPYFLIIEIFEHKEKIIELSGLDEDEFLELYYLLITKVNFIKESDLSINSWTQSHKLTNDIDFEDIAYVTLAIHFDLYFWTGDKVLVSKLRNKGFDKALYTTELLNILVS